MLSAVVSLTILGGLFGLGLGWAARRFRVESDPVVDRIDAILPQTQCGQCNYPGCRPYAEAIAAGEADINQCPPGGEAGIRALAELLDREFVPLDPEAGEEKPRAVAVEGLDDAGTRLFGELRELRRQIAVEQGVPPYVIFHDRTLAAIDEFAPDIRSVLERLDERSLEA